MHNIMYIHVNCIFKCLVFVTLDTVINFVYSVTMYCLTFTFMPYSLMQVHVVIDPYPVPTPSNFQI